MRRVLGLVTSMSLVIFVCLFAACNQFYVFNSSTGVLTPASGSPYAGDQELAVLPLQ